MFEGGTFFITEIHSMAKLNEIEINQETNDYFHTLHCVKFADMTQETREFLFAKCIDLFRGTIVMSNVQHELPH